MPDPGTMIGRYRVEALLGEGGMGRVYRAIDTQLERRVAVKVLSTVEGSDSTARILREARAAAMLDHPSIVAVFDVGEHEGAPFLVMELVAGRPLRAYVGAPPPRATLLRWLAEAARALHAAHAAGIVHRDVKPDNVMVRDDGRVKVLDFGIARAPRGAVDPHAATTLSSMAGTPLYMAPEQLRGEVADARTDQFAWGVMAYELLAGEPPWGRDLDVLRLCVAIAEKEPPPLAARPAVDAVVRRALAKEPAARWASMEEAATMLERAAGVAPAGRRRWGRGAALGVVVIGALAAAFFAVRARGRADLAPRAPRPLRHVCATQEDGGVDGCELAWCDERERRIACCAVGLAPNADGYCACPPGGTLDDRAARAGCPRAPREGVDAEALRAAVHARFADVQRCYMGALGANARLSGTVTVALAIDPDGDAYDVHVGGASLPSPKVQACIVDVFRHVQFPPPPNGGPLDVLYPLVLFPDDEDAGGG